MSAEVFLRHHLHDLLYRHGMDGLEFVNYATAGTPEFESEAAFSSYIEKLKEQILETTNA